MDDKGKKYQKVCEAGKGNEEEVEIRRVPTKAIRMPDIATGNAGDVNILLISRQLTWLLTNSTKCCSKPWPTLNTVPSHKTIRKTGCGEGSASGRAYKGFETGQSERSRNHPLVASARQLWVGGVRGELQEVPENHRAADQSTFL